jgi:hypothetical protein
MFRDGSRWLLDVRPARLVGGRRRGALRRRGGGGAGGGVAYSVVAGWRPHVRTGIDALSAQRRDLQDPLGLQERLLDAVSAGPAAFGDPGRGGAAAGGRPGVRAAPALAPAPGDRPCPARSATRRWSGWRGERLVTGQAGLLELSAGSVLLLGVSERTLRRMADAWKDRGPAGCIDGRWLRPGAGHPSITEEVREAIFAVRKETKGRARTSMNSSAASARAGAGIKRRLAGQAPLIRLQTRRRSAKYWAAAAGRPTLMTVAGPSGCSSASSWGLEGEQVVKNLGVLSARDLGGTVEPGLAEAGARGSAFWLQDRTALGGVQAAAGAARDQGCRGAWPADRMTGTDAAAAGDGAGRRTRPAAAASCARRRRDTSPQPPPSSATPPGPR